VADQMNIGDFWTVSSLIILVLGMILGWILHKIYALLRSRPWKKPTAQM
jgi:hypothetical protein